MQKVITFNKTGYDPFLDFIKAYAILCVLLGHTFPLLHETGYPLWYGMQVPLFVLIQVFHVFKKDTYKFNIKKIIQRILVPYLLVQILPLCYVLFQTIKGNNLIFSYINGGGDGPGSYYPWLYIQLAFILVFVKPWFDKGSKLKKLLITLLICEGFEIMSSLVGLPEAIHRLLPIRYFFLIYLGWVWVSEGIILNSKTIILSLLSMSAIIYFEYFYTPTEPWFYDTAWNCHRWPCFYFVSTLFSGLLYYLYEKIGKIKIVDKSIKVLAKCSYEIFLVQMIIVPLSTRVDFVENAYINCVLRIVIVFCISIVGGYYFNHIYNEFLKYHKNGLFKNN